MVHRLGGAEPQRELRLLYVAAQLPEAEAGAIGLLRAAVAVDRSVGKRTVQALHGAEGAVRLHVAGDHQDRVAGAVEMPVEVENMLARQPSEPRFPSDAPAAHAVTVVQHLVQRLDCDRRGVVRLALRFLDDHLQFARQLVGIDDRIGVGVELDFESPLEAR